MGTIWYGMVMVPVNNGEDVSLLVYAPSGTIGDYYVEWANNYMQLRPNVKIDIQLQTEDVAQKSYSGNPEWDSTGYVLNT